MPWILLLSRVLLAALFIHGGINKAMAPTATMANFAHYNLPMPGVAYALAVIVELGVGLAFLVGWKTKAAALILAVWCVATALIAHSHFADNGQLIHFYKNMAIAGGFLQVFVYGAGRFCVDRT